MKPENTKTSTEDVEDSYLPKSRILVNIIVLVRVICFFGFIGGALYSALQIFWAAEDLLKLQKYPKLHPGYFTEFLNRGRDDSDTEWEVFYPLILGKYIYWAAAYLLLSKYVPATYFLTFLSPLTSFLFLGSLVGWLPMTILVLQPTTYWFLMKIRSKSLIWIFTIGIIMFLNTPHLITLISLIGVEEDERPHFTTVLSWNCCRCVSFVFAIWNRNEANSLTTLWTGISYCFYFPLTVTGPLIMFDHYEKHIQNQLLPKISTKMPAKSKWLIMLLLIRVIFISLLLEFIFHYFYVRPLAFSERAVKKVNLWVVCGSIYWIGKIFTFKYQVMYGFPSFIAEVDGIVMHPLPTCTSYIHRYSVLWKDFDRGLYYFLIGNIYIPTVKFLDSKRRLNREVNKLLASFLTFAYIYIWHGTSYFIFLWTFFNFLGVTLERIGSSIKVQVDKRWEVKPITWDFVIEPILTAPLAGMSLLTSSIFCGSLQSAKMFSMRLWSEMGDCYVLIFLYFMAQIGVTKRTWSQFTGGLKKHLKTQ